MSRIRANQFTDKAGTGAPTFPNGVQITGVVTATSFSGSLTGNVTGNATGLSGTPNITVGTISATSLNASGVITATSFSGSGANLTGIGGTTDVRTNSLVVSGVSTFTTVKVGTAATIDSSGVQVGAGKSIRLYGATSGFSDIIAAAGSASTIFTLPANGGSNGQFLQTNGSGALSFASAGKILQVVSAVNTGQQSTASTSYVNHNLLASITPSSASNKVLILVNLNVQANGFTNYINIARNGTDINTDADGLGLARAYAAGNTWQMISFPYLDSPSSTSSTTYRVRFKADSAGTAYIGYNSNDEQYMYLLEVAA